MSQEITTDMLDTEEVWEELRYMVAFFLGRGHESCEMFLCCGWGFQYYEGSIWYPELVPLAELETKVKELEATGMGRLGNDDLFVIIPGMGIEFDFCHESDIHLRFSQSSEATDHFLIRWTSRGFSPSERQLKNRV